MTSWIPCNSSSDFPIQNLPYGVFSVDGSQPRCGTRIGDTVIDLGVLQGAGLFSEIPDILGDSRCFQEKNLNSFMSLSQEAWKKTRERLISSLQEGGAHSFQGNEELKKAALFDASQVQMHLPAQIGDYTDFYASKEHASNLGKILRPGQPPLLENYLHLPVAYHGRSSSVIPSPSEIIRPRGQTKADDAGAPSFTPCRLMDFELEMGLFIGGPSNPLGHPVKIGEAASRLFGLVLLNDWSARDIQKWEYVPLGPFGAKNFATTISPWIVTFDALEPFAVRAPEQDPVPLPYLRDARHVTYDINLEVFLQAPGQEEQLISTSNLKHMYWTFPQCLAHHSITGCNMNAGDLLGTGTLSAPSEDGLGSLIEITWRGTRPIQLKSGGERKFLQDGDRVILKGFCKGESGVRVGFGECSGVLLPALALDDV